VKFRTPATRKGLDGSGRGYDQINPTGFRDCMRDLLLDSQTFRVTFREQSVVLTRIEFRLLEQLLSTNKGVLGRQDLLSRVWGPRVSVEIRTVDSHMVRLRRKLQQLGDQGLTIETVWGVGYRMSIIDDSFFPS
jgi:DNA-binding response OmpR family regulator